MADFAHNGYLIARDIVAADLRQVALDRIDTLLRERPPPPSHTGHHFYFEPAAAEPALRALLTDSGALDLARALTTPRPIPVPPQVQVALTFPPHDHRPGRGHIDGVSVTEPDGRPGTFTLLAGVVLSDQTSPDRGNLIVWPGTHRVCAELFRREGPDALMATGGYPNVAHHDPVPVCAAPGDVIFSSYLLSHNIGPNTSTDLRKSVYYRLKVDGHDATWRDYIQDELYEFDAVRAVTQRDQGDLMSARPMQPPR